MVNQLQILIKNCEQLLHAKGMTKSKLAARLGISKQAISSLFSGSIEPSFSRIIAVAEAFGVQPFELLMTPAERSRWANIDAQKNDFVTRAEFESLLKLVGDSQAAQIEKMVNSARAKSPAKKSGSDDS